MGRCSENCVVLCAAAGKPARNSLSWKPRRILPNYASALDPRARASSELDAAIACLEMLAGWLAAVAPENNEIAGVAPSNSRLMNYFTSRSFFIFRGSVDFFLLKKKSSECFYKIIVMQ